MEDQNVNGNLSAEEISRCIALLERLTEQPEEFVQLEDEQRIALLTAAGKLSRPNREIDRKRQKYARKAKKHEVKQQDRSARAVTGIRAASVDPVFKAPKQILLDQYASEENSQKTLNSPRNCYICKTEYTKLHFFYDAMCPECGDFNYQKRFQTASLEGQVALITGARLKIGYHATLMMLRAGARVIATTRFPVDAALRFSKEDDFSIWGDRLQIHGLDLRHTPSVEIFASYIEQHYDRLDLLLNNAAQTVRRPPGFYAHLMPNEKLGFAELPTEAQALLQ